MAPYLMLFGVAAAVTFVLTPAVWRLAIHFGAVVQPGERRIHLKPTPTLGGAAMLAALYAALVVAWWMPQFRPVFQSSSEPVGVALAATVIFAVGFLDDLREVSAPAKVAGQVLAASVLGLAGVTMFYFRVPFADFYVLSPDLGFLVTVVWVVAMANAVNLIDGLDGLAAGVVAIAAGAFFVYAYRLSEVGLLAPDNMAPMVVAITCGLCVGFLPHNFHPAKVFMGDSGAMLLGLLLAATTISVGGRTADQFSGQTFFFFAPLIIPFVILGVPFVDTALAIVRRARRRTALSLGRQGAPPPQADEPGPRPPPLRVHPVGLDGDPGRRGAGADLHQPGQRGGSVRRHRPGRGPLHAAPPGGPPDRPPARGGGRRDDRHGIVGTHRRGRQGRAAAGLARCRTTGSAARRCCG